jgi:hypothetical protein
MPRRQESVAANCSMLEVLEGIELIGSERGDTRTREAATEFWASGWRGEMTECLLEWGILGKNGKSEFRGSAMGLGYGGSQTRVENPCHWESWSSLLLLSEGADWSWFCVPLPLLLRCAQKRCGAQRCFGKCGLKCVAGEKNFHSWDFFVLARCAKKRAGAQRGVYERAR